MKAVQIIRYSKDINTLLVEKDIPVITDDEVLIQVKASAVNPLDLLIMNGSIKLIQNYKMPVTLGCECSGVIVETGKNVSKFKNGDNVYTKLPINKIGAFAEYVAVNQAYIAKIPNRYDFIQSSAAAMAGLTAYQAVKDELKAEKGKTLLITGASGGFGQIAVPVAKYFGLNVIATGNKKAENKLISLGADKFIDYKKENYYDTLSNIDYVIDTLGEKDFYNALSVLKKGGKLVSLKGIPDKKFAEKNNMPFFKKLLFSMAGAKYNKTASKQDKEYIFMFVKSDGAQLKKINEIIEKYNIVPEINEKTFSLNDTNNALKLQKSGNFNGKIIITL